MGTPTGVEKLSKRIFLLFTSRSMVCLIFIYNANKLLGRFAKRPYDVSHLRFTWFPAGVHPVLDTGQGCPCFHRGDNVLCLRGRVTNPPLQTFSFSDPFNLRKSPSISLRTSCVPFLFSLLLFRASAINRDARRASLRHFPCFFPCPSVYFRG